MVDETYVVFFTQGNNTRVHAQTIHQRSNTDTISNKKRKDRQGMYRVVGEAKLRSSVYYNDAETFERVLLVPGQTYMTLKPTSMDTLLSVSRDRTSDVQLSHMPSSNAEFYDKLPDSHELHVDENSKKPYVMFNHF